MSNINFDIQSAINTLLAPAELVISYSFEELTKKKSPEKLLELWNRIVSNYNEYSSKFSGSVAPDIDREVKAKFDTALLLIAASLLNLNIQQQGVTDFFTPEEIQHIQSLESFKNLARVPASQIVELIKKNDQTIKGYLDIYNYYESNLNSLSQSLPRIANAYEIVYKRYIGRIEEALAELAKEKAPQK